MFYGVMKKTALNYLKMEIQNYSTGVKTSVSFFEAI